jgi:hypothetical protein
MNAYAVKSISPFVTKLELKRTPATEENKKIAEFIDSHDFSFDVNPKTKEITSYVALKNNIKSNK